MNNKFISDSQATCTAIMFIVGTSTMQVSGLTAKEDLWIAIIISVIMSIPMMFIYARFYYNFPQRDLFDVCELCFGKFIGKIFVLLFTLFMFETAYEVLRNLAQFITTTSLNYTPLLFIEIMIGTLCCWAVKEGIQVICRWCKFMLNIYIIFLLFYVLLSINKLNINNITPVLYNGMKPVFEAAYATLLFPFTEAITLTMAFSLLSKREASFKIYFSGLFGSAIILLIISVTSILVGGANQALTFYHPVYETTREIEVTSLLQRVEMFPSIILVLAAFIKITMLLLTACIGICKLFEVKNYKFIVIPITLNMINLSHIMVTNIKEYWEWTDKIWYTYAFGFQIILPIIVFIVSEIRKKYINIDLTKN